MDLDQAALPDWQSLYRSAAGGLLLADTDGRILRVNQIFCEWLGYRPEDLVEKQRFTKLLTMGGQVFCQTHWTPLLQMQGSVGEVKLEFRHQDGHLVPMIVNCVRRRHGDRELDELFALRILDRHKYEEEIVQARRRAEELSERLAEADRNKDEFLATLSHELRNPLAPMRNVTEILLRKEIADPQIVWAREVLARQIGYLQHLVDDLLEASRIAQGKIALRLSMVDLSKVILDAVETARPALERAGHKLVVQCPDDPVVLMGDATRLTQIVINLLTNATKFTPGGGSIGVCGKCDGEYVTIAVTDTGIGIAEAKLDAIFQMFAQIGAATQQGGLGIGLALARGLALLHDGSLTADSAGLGHGSTFTLRLPRNCSDQVVETRPAPALLDKFLSFRVVIIDDNEDSAVSLKALLELVGHEVKLASSGRTGLQLAGEERADVVLLDIGLPDMNGYQVAREIRGTDWGVSALLIAITGWGQESDKMLAEAAGFDHHFTKPVDVGRLEQVLKQHAKFFRR